MTDFDYPKRPPIWSWLISFALAGFLFTALVLLNDPWQSRYFRLDRLGSPSQSVKQDLVVAVGTSKTHCGLEWDSDMDTTLQVGGMPINFVRISRSGGTIDDLDIVFNALEKTPPKLLFVESDLILYEPQIYRLTDEPYVAPDMRQRIVENVSRSVRKAYYWITGFNGGLVDWENAGMKQDNCQGMTGTVEKYVRFLRKRHASTVADRQRYLDHFARLHKLGVTIVLLDLPRRPTAERYFPSQLLADAALARKALLDTGLVIDAGKPPKIEDREFIDAGHLTETGRLIFSYWFADQLMALLRASHD